MLDVFFFISTSVINGDVFVHKQITRRPLPMTPRQAKPFPDRERLMLQSMKKEGRKKKQ